MEYELKQWVDGEKDYVTLNMPNGDEVEVFDLDIEAYNYYYEIYHKWNVLKLLPNGNQDGWLGEKEWIVEVILLFDRLSKELEVFRIKKRQ